MEGTVDPTQAPVPRWRRAVLWSIGSASLALGVLGIFLPLLPTTPLILLAAACYARASPRAYSWLVRHRTFGPILRQWREHRTVPPAAKWTGIALVFAAFTSTALLVPNCIYGYVTLALLGSGLIIFLASLSSGTTTPAEPPPGQT